LLQFAEQVTPIRDKMNEAFHRDAYKRLLGWSYYIMMMMLSK
jgi:hypothetical protein